MVPARDVLIKDDLLAAHVILVQVRNSMLEAGVADPTAFAEYDTFGVTPVSVHRSKAAHLQAIRILGTALSNCCVREGKRHFNPFLVAPQGVKL